MGSAEGWFRPPTPLRDRKPDHLVANDQKATDKQGCHEEREEDHDEVGRFEISKHVAHHGGPARVGSTNEEGQGDPLVRYLCHLTCELTFRCRSASRQAAKAPPTNTTTKSPTRTATTTSATARPCNMPDMTASVAKGHGQCSLAPAQIGATVTYP